MTTPLRIAAFVALLSTPLATVAAQPTHVGDEPVGVPFRVRDMTFPAHLLLGFMPAVGGSLGRGTDVWELDYSRVNNWQVGAGTEAYLAETRADGVRSPLDETDVDAILRLGEGLSFFVDGEFDLVTLSWHRGLTDRLDVGVSVNYVGFGGGWMDGVIESFHDEVGYSQQGREWVEQDHFQAVFGQGADGTGFFYLERPTSGGFGDPFVSLRYAIPGSPGGWLFNIEGAVKIPLADQEKLLSSGNADYGVRLTADKQWTRNAVVLDLYAIFPGDLEVGTEANWAGGFQIYEPPSVLPGVNLSYLYRFGRWPRAMFFLQGTAAENIFADFGSAALSEPELMLTGGLKWDTALGVWGLGITENIANFDNTPDIGVHLSWGMIVE